MKNKSKLHIIAIVLGYLALLTVILCMILLTVKWVRENASGTLGEVAPVNAGAVTEDGLLEQQVTLTQAELDAMIETASANAVLEMENAVGEAAESAREKLLADLRASLSAGDHSTVEVLRTYYPDEIVVVSNGKFCFVPINRNLKMNTFNEENLNILETGEYQYLENGQVISHKGIDVSSHQGKINWKEVAADGVEFAFIRLAFRGYGTGKLVEDEEFDNNMEGALAAGIHAGVYIYSQAINAEEAQEEADLVLEKLEPYGVKCPIVFDVEKTTSPTGRMDQLSLEERTNVTLLFCHAVEKAGYTPMIYHNMEMATVMIDIETLEEYGKWFAYYNSDMYYPYEYKIWQYSDRGRVKGIKGDVDLDISFGAFWEE